MLLSLISMSLAATLSVGPTATYRTIGDAVSHSASGDTISVGASAVRALLVAAYVTVSLLGLSAVGLFISTLTEIPVGAMAATVILAITSQILDTIPQLDRLHPWLFTHYWLSFADLLRDPIAWTSFVDNARLQLGWAALFGALAWAKLTTRDVLS